METQLSPVSSEKKNKLDFKNSKYATGRRKKSIARVWLKKGSGNMYVNGKKMIDYFQKPNLQVAIFRPLTVVKRENEFDVRCSVKGGGLSGQAGAVRMGLARAMVSHNEENFLALRSGGFLTRDSRMSERKKPGLHGARRGSQFSKR